MRLGRPATRSALVLVAVLATPTPSGGLTHVSGRVVNEEAEGIADAAVRLVSLTLESCCVHGDGVNSGDDGGFDLEVEPGTYTLAVDAGLPYNVSLQRLEVPGADVSGLIVEVRREPFEFFPDRPPRGALIDILPSTHGDGWVRVRGVAGAVEADGYVVIFTLDTGHTSWVQADASGAFDTEHRAGSGASLFIKSDPVGIVIGSVLGEPFGGGEGNAAAMPGTIVRVPEPSPNDDGVPFAGVGSFCNPQLPTYRFEGTLSSNVLKKGDDLELSGKLIFESPALESLNTLQADVFLRLDLYHGPDGYGGPPRSFFSSWFTTPTQFPVERRPLGAVPGVGLGLLDLTKVAPDRFEVDLETSLEIDQNLPDGIYQPILYVEGDRSLCQDPSVDQLVLVVDKPGRKPHNEGQLPLVRVGKPAAPRLFVTLLTDTLSNGTRGTEAREDRGRYGLAQRIVTQSHLFVVPRWDPWSGQGLSYRLEPFLPEISLGDRGQPPVPPTIPFRFPSGSLTVEVRAPGGGVTTLGPAPFVQDRLRTLVGADGRALDEGGGHITDVYQLSTMDPSFEHTFTEDGPHEIELRGSIEDIWGNVYAIEGTYDVVVGRVLSLDTAVLPGTPFEVGDFLNAGLLVTPPMSADVEVRFQLAPGSDSDAMVERVVRGRTNRFGYFQPSEPISLEQAGEYRIDVSATFESESGHLWAGARTWGGVVAPPDPLLIARGRRGADVPEFGPQWFFGTQLGQPRGEHVNYPFHSGDISWQEKDDAAIPQLRFQDPSGQIDSLLISRHQTQLVQERAFGEMPLWSSTASGIDPQVEPSKIDLWAYTYRSVQRPLVRVREQIGESGMPSLYWRFFAEYGRQIGVGPEGDLPGDFKLQYGGLAIYGDAILEPQYAIYGSLFVLVPNLEQDPTGGGTRTFPPFQGNGGGPSGGPILTLRGREVDLFVHLTGTRPGSVLEIGNRFALTGAVAPPVPARVEYTVTKPGGARLDFAGRANRVGYYYRPGDDFTVDQPGRWEVATKVVFDGKTSAGQVTEPFPTGDLLGTADGSFSVYVVRVDSEPVTFALPPESTVGRWETVEIEASAPPGLSGASTHVTTMIPGFVLDQRNLTGSSYTFDRRPLAASFPMLDPSDVVRLSFFASGAGSDDVDHAAGVVVLHGQELYATSQPGLEPCVAGPETACLFDGLFKVEGSMQNFADPPVDFTTRVMTFPSGRAESDQAVFFESFDAGNFEVGVKMVNGCGFPEGHSLHNYWAFFGGLTNAGTEMRITDTVTGQVYTWTNPARSFPQTLGDTAAFPCIAGAPLEVCLAGDETACLIGGRFKVEGEMTSFADPPEIFPTRVMSFPSGRAESTQAVFFESFDVGNFEVGVKMVDGCGFPPGHPLHFYWVFYGGLTNAATHITVTQMTTGLEDEWINPARNLPQSAGRTQAFPCQ